MLCIHNSNVYKYIYYVCTCSCSSVCMFVQYYIEHWLRYAWNVVLCASLHISPVLLLVQIVFSLVSYHGDFLSLTVRSIK